MPHEREIGGSYIRDRALALPVPTGKTNNPYLEAMRTEGGYILSREQIARLYGPGQVEELQQVADNKAHLLELSKIDDKTIVQAILFANLERFSNQEGLTALDLGQCISVGILPSSLDEAAPFTIVTEIRKRGGIAFPTPYGEVIGLVPDISSATQLMDLEGTVLFGSPRGTFQTETPENVDDHSLFIQTADPLGISKAKLSNIFGRETAALIRLMRIVKAARAVGVDPKEYHGVFASMIDGTLPTGKLPIIEEKGVHYGLASLNEDHYDIYNPELIQRLERLQPNKEAFAKAAKKAFYPLDAELLNNLQLTPELVYTLDQEVAVFDGDIKGSTLSGSGLTAKEYFEREIFLSTFWRSLLSFLEEDMKIEFDAMKVYGEEMTVVSRNMLQHMQKIRSYVFPAMRNILKIAFPNVDLRMMITLADPNAKIITYNKFIQRVLGRLVDGKAEEAAKAAEQNGTGAPFSVAGLVV